MWILSHWVAMDEEMRGIRLEHLHFYLSPFVFYLQTDLFKKVARFYGLFWTACVRYHNCSKILGTSIHYNILHKLLWHSGQSRCLVSAPSRTTSPKDRHSRQTYQHDERTAFETNTKQSSERWQGRNEWRRGSMERNYIQIPKFLWSQ